MGALPQVPPVPTVEAILVLGWMEREPAVSLLLNECFFNPPIDAARAEEIWRGFRDRVEALPPRDAVAPVRMPLTKQEQNAADGFMGRHAGHANIREVIKINPMNLVTHQNIVIVEQAANYNSDGESVARYARHSLGVAAGMHNIRIDHGMNLMDVAVPHGEFAFVYDQQAKQFRVQELARHVAVTAFQGRMFLWAGYHRSYARMVSANPEGIERSLLVALTTDADFLLSPQSPNQGLREIACGLRPTLFRDFFDEDFFIRVNLKRKRFVLQVRASMVAVDDV